MRRRNFLALALALPTLCCKRTSTSPDREQELAQYDAEMMRLLYKKTAEGITDLDLNRLKEIFSHYSAKELDGLVFPYGENNEVQIPLICEIIKLRNLRIKKGLFANNENYTKLFEFILQRGSNVNVASTPFQATALHNAIHENDRVIFDILMKYKPDLNVQDSFGNTPLHHAYVSGTDPYFVEQLIKAGADRTIPNDKGKSPQPGNRVPVAHTNQNSLFMG